VLKRLLRLLYRRCGITVQRISNGLKGKQYIKETKKNLGVLNAGVETLPYTTVSLSGIIRKAGRMMG